MNPNEAAQNESTATDSEPGETGKTRLPSDPAERILVAHRRGLNVQDVVSAFSTDDLVRAQEALNNARNVIMVHAKNQKAALNKVFPD